MTTDFLEDEDDFLGDDDDLFFADEEDEQISNTLPPWKVLIVDDEPGIHQVTKFAISELTFENKPLAFLHAHNGPEAIELVKNTPDIALVLLDVVMETQTAGLEVAKAIREDVDNHLTRIILRTGQPGYAPEAEIILDYDINDYKNKTELSKDKLCTTVIAALRGYAELIRTESYRQALSKIMAHSEQLLTATNFVQFFEHLRKELATLLPLGKLYNPQPVYYALLDLAADEPAFLHHSNNIDDPPHWLEQFAELLALSHQQNNQFSHHLALLPVRDSKSPHQLFLAIDNQEEIDRQQQQLLDIFGHYVEIASANLSLQLSLSTLNSDLEAKVALRTKELSVEKQKAEQASQAKSQFLANMSHEIRTPMNAILGFTQLLIRAPEASEAQKETLFKIDKAGNHLMEIINDVLEISKIEAGAMELKISAFDLGALLEDVGQMFSFRCEQKSLKWQFINQLEQHLPVYGDQGKLRQVLINLLGNAVKFTDSGFVRMTLSQSSPHVYQLEVKDSGPGMSTTELDNLFTNFAQGKAGMDKGGTGLGLAISDKQVELMDGKVVVESQLGQGSTFMLTIPLEPCLEGVESVKPPEVQNIRLKPGQIYKALVVDDIEANRDVLGRLLQEINIDVFYAVDGKEAIEKIKNMTFDIVFMDILMPVMRGDEAIDVIRKEVNQPALVCVAISAFSLAHEIQYYIDLGFDVFIPKPFLFSDIYNCLLDFGQNKFEQIELAPADQPPQDSPVKLSEYQLSDDAFEQLQMAAELNRLSFVKEYIEKQLLTDTHNKPLGYHLLAYVENYDMDGFIDALKEVGRVK